MIIIFRVTRRHRPGGQHHADRPCGQAQQSYGQGQCSCLSGACQRHREHQDPAVQVTYRFDYGKRKILTVFKIRLEDYPT